VAAIALAAVSLDDTWDFAVALDLVARFTPVRSLDSINTQHDLREDADALLRPH